MIPRVRRWRVRYIDRTGHARLHFIDTINRRMCAIIMRTEQPRCWGCRLVISPLKGQDR